MRIKSLPEEEYFLTKDIEFVHGNILEYTYDIDRTSLIFCNCKTFSKDLMTKITEKLEQMPRGVICITTTQTLLSDSWRVVDQIRKLMSWGCATLYIQIKL